MIVKNIKFNWQATSIRSIDIDTHSGLTDPQRFCHLILGKMNGLTFFQGDEINLEKFLSLSEWEDKCLFPDKILLLSGWFTIPLMIIIGESTKQRALSTRILHLCLPKSDY